MYSKYANRDRTAQTLIVMGGIPFLIWALRSRGVAAELWLQSYMLTAFLFGLLLMGNYPQRVKGWFWKSMTPIFIMHAVVLGSLIKLTMLFADLALKMPSAMVYGTLFAVLVVEWQVSMRIINAFRPRGW